MATGSAISQNIGLVVGGAAILVVAVLAGIVISRTDTSPPDPVKTEVSKVSRRPPWLFPILLMRAGQPLILAQFALSMHIA